jgi:hypothetical protein
MTKLEDLPVTAPAPSISPALSRRAIRIFRRTLQLWESDSARISSAGYLTDQQREVLRPLARHWWVRYAATRSSGLRYVDTAVGIVACAVCLLAPAGAVAGSAVKALDPGGLLLASLVYLSVFGVLSACYFEWLGDRPLFRLGMLGAGASIVGATIVAVLVIHPLKALQFGIIAALLAVAVIAVGHLATTVFGSYFWFPMRYRYVATVPPSLATAMLLWQLSGRVEDALGGWRQDKVRRLLLAWIGNTAFRLETRMPRAMWLAGYRGPAYAEALRRYRRAGSFVREQAWRVVDANDRASFERIRNDLVEESVAVARGDWTSLPVAQQRTSGSWMLVLARRLVTPILLAGIALLLPHLPDVRLTGSALTSIQAALLVTAVLSLTPLDPSSREQVLGAFADPHHRR